MKNLYDIYEGIFDDDIEDQVENDLIQDTCNKLKDELMQLRNWRSWRLGNGAWSIRMEGDTLVLKTSRYTYIDQDAFDVFMKYKPILKFNHFKSNRNLTIERLDNIHELFKTIEVTFLDLSIVNIVRDVDFKFVGQVPRESCIQCEYSYNFYFKNVNIDATEFNGGGSKMYFSEIPAFFNTTVKGVQKIDIYSANQFSNNKQQAIMNQLFDTNYKIPVEKFDRTTTNKTCTARNLRAIKNGMCQSRYPMYNLSDIKYIKFKPNVSMDTLIEGISDLRDLYAVVIRDNDVRFGFHNTAKMKSNPKSSKYEDPMEERLPNSDWVLTIE